MARAKTHTFSSRVELLEMGMRYHVVPVPDDIALELRAQSRRVEGTANGKPINRGLQKTKDGLHFLMFGKAALKDLGLTLGQNVEISITPDLKPEEVDVPEELQVALEEEPEAKARWDTFSPGKRRSLSHYVNSAKRQDTRERRAAELAEKIRTRTLYGDR